MEKHIFRIQQTHSGPPIFQDYVLYNHLSFHFFFWVSFFCVPGTLSLDFVSHTFGVFLKLDAFMRLFWLWLNVLCIFLPRSPLSVERVEMGTFEILLILCFTIHSLVKHIIYV